MFSGVLGVHGAHVLFHVTEESVPAPERAEVGPVAKELTLRVSTATLRDVQHQVSQYIKHALYNLTKSFTDLFPMKPNGVHGLLGAGAR